MRCEFYRTGNEKEKFFDVEVEPRCGEDFCAGCGKCLACHGNEPCPVYGRHRWAIFAENPEEAIRIANIKMLKPRSCSFFLGSRLLFVAKMLPRCGKDFCVDCGYCLACEWSYPCEDFGVDHYWIKEVDSEEEARSILEEYGGVIEYPGGPE